MVVFAITHFFKVKGQMSAKNLENVCGSGVMMLLANASAVTSPPPWIRLLCIFLLRLHCQI